KERARGRRSRPVNRDAELREKALGRARAIERAEALVEEIALVLAGRGAPADGGSTFENAYLPPPARAKPCRREPREAAAHRRNLCVHEASTQPLAKRLRAVALRRWARNRLVARGRDVGAAGLNRLARVHRHGRRHVRVVRGRRVARGPDPIAPLEL